MEFILKLTVLICYPLAGAGLLLALLGVWRGKRSQVRYGLVAALLLFLVPRAVERLLE